MLEQVSSLKLRQAEGTDLIVSLWDELPNNGGMMLTSGAAVANGSDVWIDVFWDVVTTVPGTTYYIVVVRVVLMQCISGSLDNPYPDGNLYANDRLYSISQITIIHLEHTVVTRFRLLHQQIIFVKMQLQLNVMEFMLVKQLQLQTQEVILLQMYGILIQVLQEILHYHFVTEELITILI